jgi:hypothetical protein
MIIFVFKNHENFIKPLLFFTSFSNISGIWSELEPERTKMDQLRKTALNKMSDSDT